MSTESDSDSSSRLSDAEADWTLVKRSDVVQSSDEDSDIVRISEEEDVVAFCQQHPSQPDTVAQLEEQQAELEEQQAQPDDQQPQSEEQLAQSKAQQAQTKKQLAEPKEQLKEQCSDQMNQPDEQVIQLKEQHRMADMASSNESLLTIGPAFSTEQCTVDVKTIPVIITELAPFDSAASASNVSASTEDPSTESTVLETSRRFESEFTNAAGVMKDAGFRDIPTEGTQSLHESFGVGDLNCPQGTRQTEANAIGDSDGGVSESSCEHRAFVGESNSEPNPAKLNMEAGDCCPSDVKSADGREEEPPKSAFVPDNLVADLGTESLPRAESESVSPAVESLSVGPDEPNADETMVVDDTERTMENVLKRNGVAACEMLARYVNALVAPAILLIAFTTCCLLIGGGRSRTDVTKSAVGHEAVNAKETLDPLDQVDFSIQQLVRQSFPSDNSDDQASMLRTISKVWRSKYRDLVEEKAELEHKFRNALAQIHAMKLQQLPDLNRLRNENNELRTENSELKTQLLGQRYGEHPGNGWQQVEDPENVWTVDESEHRGYEAHHPVNEWKQMDDGTMEHDEEEEEEEEWEEWQRLASRLQAASSNKSQAADLLVNLMLRFNVSAVETCRAAHKKHSTSPILDSKDSAILSDLLVVCGLNKTGANPPAAEKPGHAFKRYVDRSFEKLGGAVQSTIGSIKKLSSKVMSGKNKLASKLGRRMQNTFRKLSSKVASKWEQVMSRLASWRGVKKGEAQDADGDED